MPAGLQIFSLEEDEERQHEKEIKQPRRLEKEDVCILKCHSFSHSFSYAVILLFPPISFL